MNLAEMEDPGVPGEAVSPVELIRTPRLADLAYVIFTSGRRADPSSQSHPCGRGGSGRGLAELSGPAMGRCACCMWRRRVSMRRSSRWCGRSGAGHTLVVSPAGVAAGDGLAEVIASGRVTDLVVTPSVLATVDSESFGSVRRLTTAGEACGPELVDRFGEAVGWRCSTSTVRLKPQCGRRRGGRCQKDRRYGSVIRSWVWAPMCWMPGCISASRCGRRVVRVGLGVGARLLVGRI